VVALLPADDENPEKVPARLPIRSGARRAQTGRPQGSPLQRARDAAFWNVAFWNCRLPPIVL